MKLYYNDIFEKQVLIFIYSYLKKISIIKISHSEVKQLLIPNIAYNIKINAYFFNKS